MKKNRKAKYIKLLKDINQREHFRITNAPKIWGQTAKERAAAAKAPITPSKNARKLGYKHLSEWKSRLNKTILMERKQQAYR
jgi:hypothetical protein